MSIIYIFIIPVHAICVHAGGWKHRLPPIRLIDRQSMSIIVVESTLVTLRHPEKDITVPETILRACSPVLDGILRDAAEPEEGGNKIITIDDVSLEVLEAFVGMVTMSSYAPTDISLTNDDLATSAELLMPLIHKYDCKGLLIRLQDAVNATPEVPSIFVMLQTQYGMDSRWMSKKALHCLARYLFGVDSVSYTHLTLPTILLV